MTGGTGGADVAGLRKRRVGDRPAERPAGRAGGRAGGRSARRRAGRWRRWSWWDRRPFPRRRGPADVTVRDAVVGLAVVTAATAALVGAGALLSVGAAALADLLGGG